MSKKIRAVIHIEMTLSDGFDMADAIENIKTTVEAAQGFGSAYAEVDVPAGKFEVR